MKIFVSINKNDILTFLYTLANVRFLFRPQKCVSIYRKNNKPGHNFKNSLELQDESVNAGQEAQIVLQNLSYRIFDILTIHAFTSP